MPSLSQLLGVKKGSNSPSTTSRQGFSPFSRNKFSSAASSRGRQHLRTKSENSAAGNHNGSYYNGTRFSDVSKRTSPTVRSGYDGREPYETRYERYRQIYLATSPERELSTLNAAIVNVRKWLKKKHQCLQAVRQQVAAGSAPGQSSPGHDNSKTPPHDPDTENNPQALLEKLVRESGDQQEAVDVLLDRGSRYLQQRACITLETDLENLAFLWHSYTTQLFDLQDKSKENHSLPAHPLTPLSPGKENLVQHSTPVKWRKGTKAPHKLPLSDTPENGHHPLSLEENSIADSTSSTESLSPSFAASDKRKIAPSSSDSVSGSKNLNSSFANSDKCEIALSVSQPQPATSFDTPHQKEECCPVQSASASASAAKIPFCKEGLEEGEEKILQELHSQESSEIRSKEPNGGKKSEKSRRVLPPSPPVPLRNREADVGGKAKDQLTSSGNALAVEKEDQNSADSKATEEKQQNKVTEEKQQSEDVSEKKKRSSPPSPRSRVISISQWPAPQNQSGWLRAPGEGVFTSSRPPRSTRILSLPESSTDLSAEQKSRSHSCGQLGTAANDSSSGEGASASGHHTITGAGSSVSRQRSERAAGEGVLGKRGKEIHNEQQQRQQREQSQQQQDLATARPGEGKPLPDDHHGDHHDTRSSPQHHSHQPGTGLAQLQLGLTVSEENLRMEIEEALREIKGAEDGLKNDVTPTPDSQADSPMDLRSTDNPSDSNTRTSDSESQEDGADLPTGPKRRRMNADGLGCISSGSGSPLVSGSPRISGSPLLLGGCGSPLVSGESSLSVTPTSSPAGTLPRDFRQRYKKDELWRAIESNYQYLMDKEIIETCQSTETAALGEEGEEGAVPNVSFTEFLKQYQELVDWLNQTQRHTQRTLTSLSEKYLNQTYHEELLERCPRRELLTRYSQQLLVRFPHLGDQLACRMQRLTTQWALVEAAITPRPGDATVTTMRQDLECDLAALRRWLNSTESRLLPLTIRADWTDAELEERLRHHQVLQQDIESHSRIVSAVLKLSERLEREASSPSSSSSSSSSSCSSPADCQSLQLVALTLERRWHGIWLQSLEWQCRLEEAINRRKGLYGSGINFSGFTLPTLDESAGAGSGSDVEVKPNGHISSGSNGSLFELSDDSLLFIGGARTEHHASEDSSGSPTSPGWLNNPPPRSPPLPLASPRLTNFLDRSSGDSANISECESARMGDPPLGGSPPEASPISLEGGAGSGPQDRSPPALVKVPQESKDIGYSSESQSNDETETMHQQLTLECRYGSGLIEVSSDSPLGGKMTLPAPGAVRHDYYCMTHVDLDSTDKTNTTTDDGNTTDDRDNHHLGGERKQQGRGGMVAVVGTGSACVGGLQADVDGPSPRGSHEDIAVKSYLESSDEVEGAGGEGACVAGGPAPAPCNLSESDSGSGDTQEKIRYLIDHAEELVKTSPRSTAVPGSPQRKRLSPSKQTQTAVVVMETSSVESSCDASSENSEESGNEEFSTATDDADDTLFDSVINLDSTMDSSSTSAHNVSATATLGSQPLDPARLRKQTGPRGGGGSGGGKKDRPWSVAGLQSLKKTTEFQPLSTSESAIDRMRAHTDTDSSTCMFLSRIHAATFPQRDSGGRGGYQRALSTCEQSSPPRVGGKRKLKYSSSSSATDSQSRSSATQVAPSTEDEDDRTFMYDSAEQMRSSQGLSPCVLESESETTDEYVTASMDEVMTSADEDPHNSTGSFSENAWDNYQMMYPTASEDATEEKLHWEPVDDLEFDDDFNLSFPNHSSSLLSHAIRNTANKMSFKAVRSGEDSDSDMEDFRSVLEDSETCLKVVDHSLRKKRNNPMGTGLATSGKYAEMLATCETNIDCVKNVCQHLTQEDIGIGDVQRVQELLYQWEKLQALASERLQQSQQLGVVGEGVGGMKALLASLAQCCRDDGAGGVFFSSREDLLHAIAQLKVKEEELEKQRQVLREHRHVIDSFVQHHPSVNVSKYLQELQALDHATTDAQQKVGQRVQSLEKMSVVWVQYLEGQQELDNLMAADRQRLYTLLAQREAGHPVTRQHVLTELETLESRLSIYQSKLEVLQALRQRLTGVWDDQTQRSFLASLADLKNQLHVVTQRCRQMYRDMEDEGDREGVETAVRLGHLAMAPSTLMESTDRQQARSSRSHYSQPTAMEEGESYLAVGQHDGAWQWLRWLPVQVVALIVVAGLICILDPDLLTQLTSLRVTPELRHEKGPSGL